jgi:hypothetical protein
LSCADYIPRHRGEQQRYIFGRCCRSMINSSAEGNTLKHDFRTRATPKQLRQARHRPKQGEYISESAWSGQQSRGADDFRHSHSVPKRSCSRTRVRKRGSDATVRRSCVSCYKQVQRWKCAAVLGESSNTRTLFQIY